NILELPITHRPELRGGRAFDAPPEICSPPPPQDGGRARGPPVISQTLRRGRRTHCRAHCHLHCFPTFRLNEQFVGRSLARGQTGNASDLVSIDRLIQSALNRSRLPVSRMSGGCQMPSWMIRRSDCRSRRLVSRLTAVAANAVRPSR